MSADNHNATLPDFFVPMLEKQYPADAVARIVEGCDVRRRSSLRANPLKATREQVAEALQGAGVSWDAVSWYDDAFLISTDSSCDLREIALFDQGGMYLQSLSSMIPPLLMDVKPGMDVLDMCAAPGGKTTQIVALTGGKAHVTACEMHAPRAERLEYNLRKQGATNVVVMKTDARRLDDFFSFDRILLDAPCSGSGTLRLRDPKMPSRFTEKLVNKSVSAQKALLGKALNLVKPGGVVVYSTCSVLGCENEDVVKSVLDRKENRGRFKVVNAALPKMDEGACPMPLLPSKLDGALCVCPTDSYEGFFAAKIVRLG